MKIIMKNKKDFELVSSPCLGFYMLAEIFSFVIYHLITFDALIHTGFWVILKIAIGKLHEPFHDVGIIALSNSFLNHKTLHKKKKDFLLEKYKNYQI